MYQYQYARIGRNKVNTNHNQVGCKELGASAPVTLIPSGVRAGVDVIDYQVVLADDVKLVAMILIIPSIRRVEKFRGDARSGGHVTNPADCASAAVKHGVFASSESHVVRSYIHSHRLRSYCYHCNMGQNKRLKKFYERPYCRLVTTPRCERIRPMLNLSNTCTRYLGPASVSPQRHLDRFTRFCIQLILCPNIRLVIPCGCACIRPTLTHLSTHRSWAHKSQSPNGISIGSAVYAQLTNVTNRHARDGQITLLHP